jgi:hypothetical protein
MENLMFNKLEKSPFSKFFLISLLLLALPLVACDTHTDTAAAAPTNQTETIAPIDSTSDNAADSAPMIVEADPVEATQNTNSVVTAGSVTRADLSIDEIADLLFMREEEKLARDVYLALFEQWGTPSFQNIATSEQAHMDALLSLINQYGLEDPAAGNSAGVFSDPDLQALYNQLIATGSQSLADALIVGAAVEEIDILDLQGSLAQTSNGDIVPVYQNLLAGSENHLRAFVSSWERQTGEVYQSQYLNQNEYTDIMGGSMGGNGQGQGGQSQGGQGQGSQGQGGNGNGNGNRGGGKGNGRGGNSGSINNSQSGVGRLGQQQTTS